MKVFKNLKNIPKIKKTPVAISIGKFDYVHLGHQKIIETMRELVKKGLVVIITFKNKELYPLDLKLKKLKEKGVDITVVLDLKKIKNLSYIDFLEKLKKIFNFSYLVLGKRASFGKDKKGNLKNIKKLEKFLNFKSLYLPKVKIENKIVSTSSIKKFMDKGEFKKAEKFLD